AAWSRSGSGLTAAIHPEQECGRPGHVYETAPLQELHAVPRRDGPGHEPPYQTFAHQIGRETELVRVTARGGGEVDGTLAQRVLDDLQHRQVRPHEVRAPEPAGIERDRDRPEVAGGRVRQGHIVR